MKLSVMLKTDINMGDHGEFERIAFEHISYEPIEDLVQRIAEARPPRYEKVDGTNQIVHALKDHDVIEIRVVRE